MYCYLKKSGNDPLLLLCKWNYQNGENKLGIVNYKTTLKDISIKYNFIIQPFTNNEIFIKNGDGSDIYFVSPKLLNFSLKNEFTITYMMDYPSNIKEISLNSNLGNLSCNNISKMIKTCKVNRDYFRNEKDGFYHTYYYINSGIYSILYEISPI